MRHPREHEIQIGQVWIDAEFGNRWRVGALISDAHERTALCVNEGDENNVLHIPAGWLADTMALEPPALADPVLSEETKL